MGGEASLRTEEGKTQKGFYGQVWRGCSIQKPPLGCGGPREVAHLSPGSSRSLGTGCSWQRPMSPPQASVSALEESVVMSGV